MIPTQKEFYAELARRTNMKQYEVKAFYEEMVDMIIESMNSSDETVTMIPKIGSLQAKPVPAHTSINPQTGKTIVVDTGRKVHLRLKPALKRKANDGYINAEE